MRSLLNIKAKNIKSKLDDPVYISNVFQRQLLSHVCRASLNLKYPFSGAQILAIQGPPGSGKSFQTRYVLKKYGIYVSTIEASMLSR